MPVTTRLSTGRALCVGAFALLGLSACRGSDGKKGGAQASGDVIATPEPLPSKAAEGPSGAPTVVPTALAGGELETALAACGPGRSAAVSAGAVLFDKKLTSFPFRRAESGVEVTLATDLNLKVTSETSEQVFETKVLTITGLFASLAWPEARRKAAVNNGNSKMSNIPFAQATSLAAKKGWEKILCTLIATTRIELKRGDKSTIASFDPPLPSAVSPQADPARYAAEIGDKLAFRDIKASVLSSNHPDLAGVKELNGTVVIEKVAGVATVTSDDGQAHELRGDLAYKLSYNFGDPAKTYALGLAPVIYYYISHQSRALTANRIDTSMVGGANLAFLH